MSDGVALFCTLHPESQAKQERCLDLLRLAAREWYRSPKAKCTTWSYFTPYPPPKPNNASSTARPTIGGLEIYTSKATLQSQVNDPVYFQSYHEAVKREVLYEKPEELVAWYFADGFVARETDALPFGSALVSVTRMVCRDREEVFGMMKAFAQWVRTEEPGVLTYAMFTRPKAPKEIMLFVRYVDSKALKAHSTAPEHQDVVKKLGQMLENKMGTSTTLWKEVEDSFVSNAVGGNANVTAAKL